MKTITPRLYGKKSIAERLTANPASVKVIYLEKDFNDARLLELAAHHHVQVERISPRKLQAIKSTRNMQGIVAEVDPFVYAPYGHLLDLTVTSDFSLVFLDGINDPHNLGVILRTLACLGGFGVIIPFTGACEVNDTVMHVAVGGENHVPVARVDDLSSAIVEAKQRGICITGSVVDSGVSSLYSGKIRTPAGLVFGSEHGGIQPALISLLDEKTHIPTPGANLSLNITIACALVCSEIKRTSRTI